jgi:predicted metal-dependent hydrolase
MTKTVRRIILGGREFSYECTRKKVKNINIRVRPDGKLCVSAPSFVSFATIEDVLKKKEAFLLNAFDRVAERKKQAGADFLFEENDRLSFFGKEYILHITDKGVSHIDGDFLILSLKKTDEPKNRKEAFKRFAEKELRAYASETFTQMLPLFEPHVSSLPDLKLYTMLARWGSCRVKTKVITLNTRLAFYPKEYIDYVIAHEFTHLLHADHSKAFYAALALRMPDWERKRKALNDEPMKEYF